MTFWRILLLIMILGGLALVFSTVQAQEDDPPEYIGEGECNDCHGDLADNHEVTAHALTLTDDPEGILADFAQGQEVRTVAFPSGPARPFQAEDIAFVIGAGRHVQRYAYQVEEGVLKVLPAQWNTVTGQWESYHADLDWLTDPAMDFGVSCVGCHVTGLEADELDWEDDGVQCEACHGPGSAHADAADEGGSRPDEEELAAIRSTIYVGMDAATCGQCHSQGLNPDETHPFPTTFRPGMSLDEHFSLVAGDASEFWWASGHASRDNMQYNEWISASHAASLETMLASDYADDSCLACHSADPLLVASQLASIEAEDREPDPAPIPITLQNAQNGVTCLACHDAHPNPEAGLPYQLRLESYALCTACHSDADPSDGLHSTSQQLYEGVTLVEEVAGVPSGHFAARQQGESAPDCAGCHLARVPVDGILRASHTSQPLLPGIAADLGLDEQSCTACHAEQADGAALQTLIEDIQTSTATRLEAIQAAQQESDPAWVGLAVQFIVGDGSLGVHNYAYTASLLDALEAHLGLGGQSE